MRRFCARGNCLRYLDEVAGKMLEEFIEGKRER